MSLNKAAAILEDQALAFPEVRKSDRRAPIIAEIPLLRAIGIIGVVLIHVAAGFLQVSSYVDAPGYIIYSFINQAARYAVPLFIFVSGFTLFYNYPRWEGFPIREYFQKRLGRILVPYIVWSIIYYIVTLYITLPQGEKILASALLVTFGKNLLLGSSFYHLYFFLLIIQFYVLFPAFLFLWSRKPSHLKLWCAVCFAVQILLSIYVNYLYDTSQSGFLNGLAEHQHRFFPFFIAYFVLGAYLATRLDDLRKASRYLSLSLVVSALAAIALTAEFVYFVVIRRLPLNALAVADTRPGIVIYALILILSLYWLSIKVNECAGWPAQTLARLGDRAYGIYLIHPFYLLLARFLLDRMPLQLPHIIQGVILFVVVTYLSYVSTAILGRAKITRSVV